MDTNELNKRAIKVTDRDYSYIDGSYLRKLRMSFGMSQALFADYLGVTKKAIEKWEQGVNKINAPVLRLLFLFENNPELLSLMKEIKISNKNFILNRIKTFEADEIINSEKDDSEIEVNFSSKKSWKKVNGGKTYVPSNV
ncbi:MAG: helix-turn-helix domain-containing protein [Acholeplasmatales bacterium]|nr:helix-turn-helix domain-containing protein [Acholeplasmatales bacterium]